MAQSRSTGCATSHTGAFSLRALSATGKRPSTRDELIAAHGADYPLAQPCRRAWVFQAWLILGPVWGVLRRADRGRAISRSSWPSAGAQAHEMQHHWASRAASEARRSEHVSKTVYPQPLPRTVPIPLDLYMSGWGAICRYEQFSGIRADAESKCL